MAVPKRKISRSKRGKRRSQKKIKKIFLSIDKKTGESHIRHQITDTGFYKGKKVINKN